MENHYVDINTIKFLLYEVYQLKDHLKQKRFEEYDEASIEIFLNAVKDFSDRELFPYFKAMDDEPAHFQDGKVVVHPQVGKVMKMGGEMGLISGPFNYEDGGLQLPLLVHTAATYIQDAANNHLPGYLGLTQGAAELIVHFGNKSLNATYVPKMLAGEWGGTMCLTEPQAGSSLSDIMTKAVPQKDGSYAISGQKIFISAGDHEYAENFVHLVLARIEGAPAGTKGISLFVVPKKRLENEASLVSNDVITTADFQKMGQRGYCTTHLIFGEKNDCRGWIVGEMHQGLKYMFLMMNGARIGVGRGAAAIAMAAYQTSLAYAKERPQGRRLSASGKKDTEQEQSLIINHPDVRRMLLLQKTIAEGALSLVLLASKYHDLSTSSEEKHLREKYGLLLELITPIVKTYPSEMGSVAVSNGLQILGGYGFCTDFILQQYYRDIRIFPIYEGTTGIQSLDLLGRKVTMNEGQGLLYLAEEIQQTIASAQNFEDLKPYALMLGAKLKVVQEVLQVLQKQIKAGNFERYLADATPFMEFLSTILIAWLWLDMAVVAKQMLNEPTKKYTDEFYLSKIHAMKFYFTYELVKTTGLAELLTSEKDLTLPKHENLF